MSDQLISIEDVRSAAKRIDGIVNRTPVFTSHTLNDLAGCEVFLKAESFQRTGAFKFRGAYNAISRLDLKLTNGVVAYSSGNHAQGVALAARLLGIPALILMHSDAPANKLGATKEYGAEVVLVDRTRQDGETLQFELAEQRGMTVVHAYDDPHIMAGQGTAALEFLDEIPSLDTLVMPVGGGGLISGCTVAAKGIDSNVRIFGVETIGADDTHKSLRAGHRVEIPPPTTIADGIRLTTPGKLTFPVVQRYAEDVVLVTDEDVVEALKFVITRMKLVIEPTGAVPVAALLQQKIPLDRKRVGVIISGGNLDPSMLAGLFGD